VEAFRKQHDIKVVGPNIPHPVRAFEEAGFPGYVLKDVLAAGFDKPTSIQSQGWPMALSGRDLVCHSLSSIYQETLIFWCTYRSELPLLDLVKLSLSFSLPLCTSMPSLCFLLVCVSFFFHRFLEEEKTDENFTH
jgi:hypothetical protein